MKLHITKEQVEVLHSFLTEVFEKDNLSTNSYLVEAYDLTHEEIIQLGEVTGSLRELLGGSQR